jgi:hypothetical protein
MICHQRTIREEMLATEGCALGDNLLKECSIEQISRKDAATIIMRYEWLKSMPQVGFAYYGLFTPGKHVLGSHRLIGAVCFGAGPAINARDFCGAENIDKVVCLERGACAPIRAKNGHSDNAASYLITHACKSAYRDYGWGAFYAYSDVAAGEIGTVYQAAGWTYLGQGAGRVRQDGTKCNRELRGRYDYIDPQNRRHTSRRMRAMLKRIGYTDGHLGHWFETHGAPSGWRRERQYEKHKYVLILDKNLSLDTERFPPQPMYPSRNIETVGAQLVDWRQHRWPGYGVLTPLPEGPPR